jgi:small conductance mechanosensitive channel
MDVNTFIQSASVTLIAVAWKVAGAIVLWLVGRWLISFAIRMLGRALSKQQFDLALSRYLQTGLSVILNIALLVASLGLFGVETTTFAALLAAGGVTGTVDAIGLFGTTLNTPDNVQTIIGNNKVFSDTIQNYSANPYRRVDLTATISNSVNHNDAIRLLKRRLARVPHVLASPAPDVDILQFTPAGPQLCVRPYCHNAHYWQVYFDTNRLIRESFGEAGYPAPVPAYAISSALVGPPHDTLSH